MRYTQIYPDGDVTLADLARAALEECGRDHVTVVSGMGTQVIRVQEDCALAVMRRVGLDPADDFQPETEPEPPHAPPATTPTDEGPDDTPDPPQTASGPEEVRATGPGPDAPKVAATTAKTAEPDTTAPGRPADRPAGQSDAKKTTRRTTRRTKEA